MIFGAARFDFAVLICVATAWEEPVGSYGWQRGSAPPWKPHTGSIATALSDGSALLIAGQAGLHGGATLDCFNCTNEVWRFHPDTDTWTDLSDGVPWDPRWGHSAIALPDDTVWMMFGCCEKGRPTVMFRDLWTYNPTKGQPWKKIEAYPPHEGLQAASIAFHDKHFWIVGGWSQHRGTMSVITKLHIETLQWDLVSDQFDAPWPARADHGTAISPDGHWIFIFGGQHCIKGDCHHWTRLKDTWRAPLANPEPSQWVELGEITAARSSPCVNILPTGWLITTGGHWTPETELLETTQDDVEGMQAHHEKTEFRTYNDVLALNMNDGGKAGWRVLEAEAPYKSRDDAASTVTKNGSIIIFGGGTTYGGGGYHQDVWRLTDVAKKYGLGKSHAAADEL